MYFTDHTQSSGLSGAECEEDTLKQGLHHRQNPYNPTINCHGFPKPSNCGPQLEQELTQAGRQERLPRGRNLEEVYDEKEGEADSVVLA